MKHTQRFLLARALVLGLMMCGARFAVAQSGTSSISASASADVPRTISYQGVLRSDDGTPVTGVEPMTIRLYADSIGETLVWEDTFSANSQNGLFNLMLGSQKPLPASAQMGIPLWVAVKIGEARELRPYAPLASAPYALTVANGAITAEKMATDYVGSISLNGTQITGKGSNVNLMAGNGLSLSYDPVSSAIWLSASGSGRTAGKGAQLQANRVWTFNGRKDDVVSVSGDYSFSQISGNANLTSQVTGTLPIAHGGTGATTATANKVFAGPTSGGASAPSFRSIVAADIPTLNQNTTGTASNVTGIVSEANGGTGASTATANKVFAGPTSGGASAPSFRSLVAGDIPTLNQNTTGMASNVTGMVAAANGGTGAASATANTVFAGPTSGGASAPSFRSIVAADIPTLNQNTTGTSQNVTGIVAEDNGGTGVTNASGVGQSAFFGGPSSGGAGAASFRALTAGDIPTLNQNTTGTASSVTGTVAVDHGGTGSATASAHKVFAGPTSGGSTAPSFRSIVAGDIPTLNQNTTGTSSNVTGTVAVAHGGTGAATAPANKVFAGPVGGGNAAPTFRSLVASDIPTLNQNTTGVASNVTGIVSEANGGTGVSNASGVAQAAFFGGPSSGGAGAGSYRSIVPSDVPTLNQNTTGTASNVTGIVAAVNGGTGVTTASANMVFAGPVSGSDAAPSFRVLDTSDIPSLASRYIVNDVVQQSNGNFNIDGSGQVGTTLTAGGNINTTGGGYQSNGTTILFEDGSANLFVGASAGSNIASGYYNMFSGMDAGKNNTDGFENTFLGTGSGYENTTGTNNTYSGTKSGFTNSTGNYNTFVGGQSGYNNSTGNDNTFLGSGAGPTNLAGNDITLLGYNSDVGSDGLSDATAVGDGAVVNSSYTVQLGDASVTQVHTNGDIAADGSLKTGGHIFATSSATAASADTGVTVGDVPVFVISAGSASANFLLTMPASPATGDMIVVINQDATYSATYGTTAVVTPLGSRTFYYDGTSWQ